ncbi:transcriptional regulator [Vogesella sp. GCM10023246]|uniref:WYL domain-containing protein n=1 Tax=Vogesella oryzagri TaxID=3160864 RepID=A0ABV1M7D9_9NEIS
MSPSLDELYRLTHNQRQRLSYLEFCLYFLGEVRRADMMARFDCAPAVVTRDIALYRQLAPANLELDPSSKAYHILSGFVPLFEHRLEQVIAALMQGEPYSIETLGRALLPGDYPSMLNRPAMPILAAVSRAIRQQRLLKVRYHSASSGEQERIIAPHALVDSGLRWHVRAYDRLRGAFIDLVLTRLLAASLLDEAPAVHEQAGQDEQWQQTIPLQLVPHPKLLDPAIATLDYAMNDGVLTINARAANVGYLLRRWYVDCSADASINDPACRLWLQNIRSIKEVQSRVLAPGYKD